MKTEEDKRKDIIYMVSTVIMVVHLRLVHNMYERVSRNGERERERERAGEMSLSAAFLPGSPPTLGTPVLEPDLDLALREVQSLG